MKWFYLLSVFAIAVFLSCACGIKSKEDQSKEFFDTQDNSGLRTKCNSEGKIASANDSTCLDAKPITTGCTADQLEAAYPQYVWSETRDQLSKDLADGYEIVECGLNEEVSQFFDTVYINMAKKKVEGNLASVTRKTLEAILVVKKGVETDSFRKLLAGKQLLVTAEGELNRLNHVCYQFNELPGKCQRWKLYKNGLSSEKEEHECDVDLSLFMFTITCKDSTKDGCLSTEPPSLEFDVLNESLKVATTEFKTTTRTWKIATDACKSGPDNGLTNVPIREVLAGKQLLVSSEFGLESLDRVCYQFAELPGKCQRWRLFKKGLGTDRLEHDCDAENSDSMTKITCADATRAGCMGTDSPMLESAFLEAVKPRDIGEFKDGRTSWKIGTDVCPTKSSFIERIESKLANSDFLHSFSLGTNSNIVTCIRFSTSIPGNCQFYNYKNSGVTLDACRLQVGEYGSLRMTCEGETCKNATYEGTKEELFGVNIKDLTANADFTKFTIANRPNDSITIGQGLCGAE